MWRRVVWLGQGGISPLQRLLGCHLRLRSALGARILLAAAALMCLI